MLFLTKDAAERVRSEIAAARQNEVCFVAKVDDVGAVRDPEVVARGNRTAVPAALRDGQAGTVLIHNHPSGRLDPSDADLEVAARLADEGTGFAITDNLAQELYVVVEPKTLPKWKSLDPSEVDALLGPGGEISRAHPAYEDRPVQRELAAAVTEAYNRGGIRLAEAGTGTGKSIGYLVPAILWAVKNRDRTVVSTNTINLQEQLVGKDLPFLRRALGEPFRFALVKGRRNYISIRRAHLAMETTGQLFETNEVRELDAIAEWLKETDDGSLQDLPFTPSEAVWDEIASEADVCLRARCPHFDRCFYQRARRTASGSDILVVNHQLLFSDLAVRRAKGGPSARGVLPAYRRVVLDEAHNLEEAATSHLGAAVSRLGAFRLLSRLDRRGKGILATLADALMRRKRQELDGEADRAVEEIAKELRPAVDRARTYTSELFGGIDDLLTQTDDGVVRLPVDFAAQPVWVDGPAVSFENLLNVLETLAFGLKRVHEALHSDERRAEALAGRLLELEAAAERVRTMSNAFVLIFSPRDDAVPMVRWLEQRRRVGKDPNPAACAAPIELGGLLRESLFERVETAILTSATLTTEKGFDFLRGRLGLDRGGLRIRESMHASPFDFETQAVVAIPTDLPVPAGASQPGFDRATADVVEGFATATGGGIFVLFTSYRSMRTVAAELRSRGAGGRWPLHVQGEAPRAKLIERFVASGSAVLLGVASFWEGVDVPGEPLRGLILAKIPFKVPSEPLTAARVEAIQEQGGDAFREYMLPHAALRLKQGFGRLIRSRHDRGVVVLLDRRILEKSYGRYLLASLPPAPVLRGSWAELARELEPFYAAGGPGRARPQPQMAT